MRRKEIAISLASEDRDSEEETDPPVLAVPWSKTPHRRHRDVLVPEVSSQAEVRPIRSDTRVKLVVAIARGRKWLSEIEAGTVIPRSRHDPKILGGDDAEVVGD